MLYAGGMPNMCGRPMPSLLIAQKSADAKLGRCGGAGGAVGLVNYACTISWVLNILADLLPL